MRFNFMASECLFPSWLWKQNGGQCVWAYGGVNKLGGPVIPSNKHDTLNKFVQCSVFGGIAEHT